MKRLLIVANGGSGKACLRNSLFGIIDEFVRADYAVEVYTTQARGDARRIARERGSEFSRIVSCGGDGTANEVLTGLMSLPAADRPELAIIPTGTTNDYAYSLGIPSDPESARRVAARGTPRPVDAGRFGERYFTYVAAFGMFTRVTYETPQASKNLLGHAAYLLEGAKDLLPVKTQHVRVDFADGSLEGDYALGLFTNAVSVGGIRTVFSGAALDDGLLEITLVKAPKTLADLQSIAAILAGRRTPGDIKSGFVDCARASRAAVSSDEPVRWTLDGEDGGAVCKIEIAACPRAVTVITGERRF